MKKFIALLLGMSLLTATQTQAALTSGIILGFD